MSQEQRRLLDGAVVYIKLRERMEVSDIELRSAILALQSTDTVADWINKMVAVIYREQRRRQRMTTSK